MKKFLEKVVVPHPYPYDEKAVKLYYDIPK